MRKGMFLRLALTNIKKNRGTFVPYILSSIGCIAVLYIMLFIVHNPDTRNIRGGSDVAMIVSMGVFVLGVFSVIFLLFCNSFLMKRRQKEIGLYNVLGMEKRHISRMLLVETLITGAVSLTGGIGAGILGSKLALLFLLKMLHLPVQFGFYVTWEGVKICAASYGMILAVTLLQNLSRVHLSRPVELLSGKSVGEREPKTKLLMAVLGFACLGGGYYLAVTTKSVMDALVIFLLAVLLVMAGTYLVFTAGSIMILKLMRRKKSFYYKIQNFTSVSGMLYRMKQNAVGLASICILSTGVLLMISSAVSLNMGIEDAVKSQYPYDVNVGFYGYSYEEAEEAQKFMRSEAEKSGIPVKSVESEISLSAVGFFDGHHYTFDYGGEKLKKLKEQEIMELVVIPEKYYQSPDGEKISLENGTVLIWGAEGKSIDIGGREFSVAGKLKEEPDISGLLGVEYVSSIYLVTNPETFKQISEIQRKEMEKGGSMGYRMKSSLGIMVDGEDDQAVALRNLLDGSIEKFRSQGYFTQEGETVSNRARAVEKENFYGLHGGLLFVGILLGGVFLMGTALIIYYKQISEGYEDRERFQIMRKVGMSRREVRSSIRRQILMVFFLPLLAACVHIGMAFPLMKKLLLMIGMSNDRLFLLCTAATVLMFAAIYGLIYMVTARAYYHILEKAE